MKTKRNRFRPIFSILLAAILTLLPAMETADAFLIESNVKVLDFFTANFMYEKKIDMRNASDRKTIPNADFDFDLWTLSAIEKEEKEKEEKYGIGKIFTGETSEGWKRGYRINEGKLRDGAFFIPFSHVSFRESDIYDPVLTDLIDKRFENENLGEEVIDHILKYDWGVITSSSREETAIARKPTDAELAQRKEDEKNGIQNNWPEDTIAWKLPRFIDLNEDSPGSFEEGGRCLWDQDFESFSYSKFSELRTKVAVNFFPYTYQKPLITHQEKDSSGNYISLSKGLLLPHEYYEMIEKLEQIVQSTHDWESDVSYDSYEDDNGTEIYQIHRYLLKERQAQGDAFVPNNEVKIVDFIPGLYNMLIFNNLEEANEYYQNDIKNEKGFDYNSLAQNYAKTATFTNEYKPETPPVVVVPDKMTISVVKRWVDEDNRDNKRPESVTVQLLADGKETGKTLVLNADKGWSGSFTDLPKEEKGSEIKYTVKEVGPMKGYVSAITGDQKAGFTITNTYETEKIKIEGKKTWEDGNNVDGKRPESITVRLLANGVEKESRKVTEKDGWKWTFTDLPKFDKGQEITYSLSEDPVKDYTSEVKGFDITNTRTSQKKVPNKPNTTNKPSTSSKSKSPKTGDTSKIYFWTSILLLSCLVFLLVKKGKLRKTKSDR
ncbi:Cna B-type domain-containing protein [Kallipyga gabonensis]|uniref:Cna B-type domain-containing protein n=1 Tax=Kallipyga gabonensis TaxID=1686287 RepID=UPI0006B67C9E|nr:Cna B-type domain-containing protein [Kallipyga gabonensis]